MSIPCKRRPVGLESLPSGYTRLGYLESTGDANILLQFSSIETGGSLLVSQDTQFLSSVRILVGFAGYSGLYWGCRSNALELGSPDVLPIAPYSRNSVSFETAFGGYRKLKAVLKNGDSSIERLSEPSFYPKNWQYGIFALAETDGYRSSIRVWSCSGAQDELHYNLVPCSDPTGTPCMFDAVSRKPFYNQGTGSFIAGVENQVQLDNMLRKLPDRTGQTAGTLQVRLADELQTPENEAKLAAMLSKNWEITQAAA